jgi:thiol reductant ABC exporter CydC subunit
VRALRRVTALGRPVTGRLLLAVLAGAAAAGASIGLAATSAWLISRAAEQPPILSLLVAITAVRFFGIARGVFRYAERLAAHDAAFRVLVELRAAVYERLARLAPVGVADLRSGDLLARLVDDVDGLADVWLRVLLPGASVGLIAAVTVLVIGWLVPAAGLVVAITVLVVVIGAPLAALAVSHAAERRIVPARGELSQAAVDVLQGAPELVAASAVEGALGPVLHASARLAVAERAASIGAGIGTLVAALAAGAATWLATILAIAAARDGSIGGVAIAVVALTPIALHEVVAPLVPAARGAPALAAAAGRVVGVIDRADPVPDPASPVRPPDAPCGLLVRDLHVRYPGASRDAVAGLDLDVPAGSRVVLTGPSGAGKTTLAFALLRFLPVERGRLEVIGAGGSVELEELRGEDARRLIGYCPQEVHLFDTSLGENIRLARPSASADEVADAVGRAQLGEWIGSLPGGFETPVGERGARLSGGQRQRVALARALLSNAPILLLDEPTEHLDEPTARAFVADLIAATAGRTVLVLTHRPELFPSDAGWTHAAMAVEAATRPPGDPAIAAGGARATVGAAPLG